jgi:hypothetical protein
MTMMSLLPLRTTTFSRTTTLAEDVIQIPYHAFPCVTLRRMMAGPELIS